MSLRLAHWSLLLIVMTGCATSRPSNAIARKSTPPIARAESDHLSDLSGSAREKHSSESKPSRKHDSHHRSSSKCSKCGHSTCTCDSDSIFSQVFGQIALAALMSPFSIPISIVENSETESLSFLDYPYADGLPGLMVDQPIGQDQPKEWSGTFQGFGIPESGDITRIGGRLLLESSSRLGIDTETNYWTESLSSGDSQLWTGDANLVYRFAQSERVQCRAGIGMNWLADSKGAEGGFNFTYGIDWFPKKPWTVSTIFDVGTLGGGTLFHNRTTAGVMLGPVEAFAGYDYFQVGSANFHGPVAGLGLRF